MVIIIAHLFVILLLIIVGSVIGITVKDLVTNKFIFGRCTDMTIFVSIVLGLTFVYLGIVSVLMLFKYYN